MNITMQGRPLNSRGQYDKGKSMDKYKPYRITIYSKDLISGQWNDGLYSINLDHIDIDNAFIGIESLILLPSNNVTSSVPFIIEIPSLIQNNTFSTSTKTNSPIIFQGHALSTGSSFNYPIASSSIGIPLSDPSFFRNKNIRIVFKNIADSTSGINTSLGSSTSFVLSLVIYKYER